MTVEWKKADFDSGLWRSGRLLLMEKGRLRGRNRRYL